MFEEHDKNFDSPVINLIHLAISAAASKSLIRREDIAKYGMLGLF